MDTTSGFLPVGSRFGDFTVLERLHESQRSVVLRCLDASGRKVVKFLRAAAPSPGEVARFRREFELSRRLAHAHVVSATAMGSHEGLLFMAMPDDNAVALRDLLQGHALPARQALQAAIAVVQALEAVHARNVVHKDIAPGNIVANFAAGTVKLIDFGIAAELSSERPELARPEDLEGTLSTMAPEQSGRMNRDVDYRADFYALGATLFELLTGEPPLRYADPLEAVHAHLTHQPRRVTELQPTLAPLLADLVAKLLAKEPGARYQSHVALQRDLAYILAHLDTPDALVGYPLAANDLSARLQVSGLLYGRCAQVGRMLDAFTAAARGTAQLVTVAGFSGIGKTALVHELQTALLGSHGHFISGKFNQFGQHAPYAAFTAALQQRGRQVLALHADEQQRWRAALLQALGANAALVADAVPDLARLLGPLPAVLPLGPTEAENRVVRSLQQCIAALAAADAPLVLFIDDLQWADRASRRLLRELALDEGLRHVLLIGAYRSNEVPADHPLAQDLQLFAALGPRALALQIGPLQLEDTRRLLADTLHSTPEAVDALAVLCQAKTGGNPFFLRRFVQDVARRGLIWLDRGAARWCWAIERIQAERMADNVVDLMVEQLRRLPADTARLLTTAACLGTHFELAALATVSGQDEHAVLQALRPALEAGLLVPDDARYKWVAVLDAAERAGLHVGLGFAHDRVQEAAYSLAGAAERPALHLRIGRLLRSGIDPQRPPFDVVNHLNLGVDVMDSPAERADLAALNARASGLAQDAAAFELAAHYADRAIALHGPAAWQADPAGALVLHAHAARMAYLGGQPERMEMLLQTALPHAHAPLEQARLMDVRIESFYAAGQLPATLDQGLAALGLLGLALPAAASPQDVVALVAAVKQEIEAMGLAALAARPPMHDALCLQQHSIIAKMTAAAYIARPALLPLLTVVQVRSMMAHGHAPAALSAYSVMGLMAVEFLGDTPFGYALGRMSMDLIERHGWRQVQAHAGFSFNAFLRHWVEPVAAGLPALLAVNENGQEFGNLRHPGLALYVHGVHALLAGEPLAELAPQLEAHAATLRRIRQPVAHDYLWVLRETVYALQQQQLDAAPLENARFSMRELRQTYEARSDQTGAMFLHAFAGLLHGLAGRHAQAESEGLAAMALFPAGRGMSIQPYCVFFTATAALALARQDEAGDAAPASAQRRSQVAAALARLQHWAQHNTELAPLWRLLRAGQALLDDDRAQVRAELQAASQAAAPQGNLFLRGVVHWQRALLLASLGDTGARVERAEARTAFLRWGARALTEALAEPPTVPPPHALQLSLHSTSAGSQALDLVTLMKAVQAVTAQTALGPLLERMLHVLRENAGAQRVAIVLQDAEGWTLQADSAGTGPARPMEAAGDALPLPMLRTALNTGSPVLIDDLPGDARWQRLEYFVRVGGRSVLCMPLVQQAQVVGALYLENGAVAAAFSPQRMEFLHLLSGNVVNAIDNARLVQQLRVQAETLEQRVAERTRELRDSEARTLSILQNAPVPMTVTRRSDGVLVYVNAPAAAAVGFTQATLMGKPAQTRYRDPADRARLFAQYRRQGVLRDAEACLLTQDGQERWTLISLVPIVYDGEAADLATIIDITERKAMEEALRRLATTDALTGVSSRGHFMHCTASEVERAQRYGRPLAMLMLDIDHFKKINDRHGHSGGDAAIRGLTVACADMVRHQDLVGRLGGEEFGILMPETDLDAAYLLAERLRAHIAALDVALPDHGEIRMTASFGVSALRDGDDVEQLIARADRALYASKHGGRNRVSLQTPVAG
ncbi:diguanylate cyclase [Pseudorhodoferax sp. Leaf267]|uniref:diguanylate cyclase n=1 Tax=Pseudorhodoferax sp. Leaf267 TaxID=1736316 RepID=UPI000B206E1D|nr:diguanylate cyclase [Pseudorhodoferax sp. Leaf267]